MLSEYSDVFCVSPNNDSLQLIETLNNANSMERSVAIANVTSSLKQKGIVSGWRNELISVALDVNQEPFFKLERAAYPLFGVVGYGIHVNGFVKDDNAPGGKKLWIGTRSLNKQTYPGLRDHIVAGQISEGMSPSETLIKECEEEAGISSEIAKYAKPVGCVSHRGLDLDNQAIGKDYRLKRDVIYCYDLELPCDFVPRPMDGEVESFELMNLEQVCEIIETSIIETSTSRDVATHPGFKPNCVLVILDFLIRSGYISSDSPGYFNLVSSLRRDI